MGLSEEWIETVYTMEEGKKLWTIASLIQWGSAYLEDKGFESPRLNVELLLAHALRCRRIDLFLNFEKPLSPEELARFKELLKRRLTHEPLQYITGEAHFMGLVFSVDRRVLIPRPETEILVERTIDLLRGGSADEPLTVLDIGTGSGNISVSIAHYVKNVHVTAIDVSDDALTVARHNASQYRVDDRIVFQRADIFTDIAKLSLREFDCIVSNPPYITRDQSNTLVPEIIQYEPSIAVFGDESGMLFFRRIAEVGKHLLRTGGWVLVETAYDQASDVKSIFDLQGYRAIQIFKDYDGNDRVVQSQWV